MHVLGGELEIGLKPGPISDAGQPSAIHLDVGAHHLADGDALILMGDLNDGPGLDEYERLFGRSSVEIVMGEDLFDPHARKSLQPRSQAFPSSARFYNPETKRYFRALLDYIMISSSLMALRPEWRIWHPFEDEECYSDPDLREATLVVRYESLCRNPAATLAGVLAHCGLTSEGIPDHAARVVSAPAYYDLPFDGADICDIRTYTRPIAEHIGY